MALGNRLAGYSINGEQINLITPVLLVQGPGVIIAVFFFSAHICHPSKRRLKRPRR